MPSKSSEPSIRLGVVQYLNTKPLVLAFESDVIEHPFNLVYDVPSECARKLHAHQTDVAIIPAIEICRAPEPYSVVKGVGICSVGPVNSVFLVLKKDPEDVKSVALDTSSRSSVALTQILLKKRFNASAEPIDHPPDVDRMLERADAAVLIGDLALELDRERYRVLDLGQAWTDWTGLPFFYAVWTGRAGRTRNQRTIVSRDNFRSGWPVAPWLAVAFGRRANDSLVRRQGSCSGIRLLAPKARRWSRR